MFCIFFSRLVFCDFLICSVVGQYSDSHNVRVKGAINVVARILLVVEISCDVERLSE